VLDVTETAALAARKAAMAATSIPVIVPLPRPRPVINAASSDRPRHRVLRSRDGQRGPLFSVFAPLFKGMH
jgi:anti-sigma factor RsiW